MSYESQEPGSYRATMAGWQKRKGEIMPTEGRYRLTEMLDAQVAADTATEGEKAFREWQCRQAVTRWKVWLARNR